ncbi:MAG: FHA domain-containing protein [Pirellulales bacterium]
MNAIEINILNGIEQGRSIRIEDRTLKFGRSSSADVVIGGDALVSSRHLQIGREGNSFFVTDLGSTNGTRVNDEPITRKLIRVGDKVQLGSTVCLVALPADQIADDVVAPPAARRSDNPIESSIVNWNSAATPSSPQGLEVSSAPVQKRNAFLPTTESNPSPDVQERPPLRTSAAVAPVAATPMESAVSISGVISQVRLLISESSGASPARSLFWLSPGQSLTFGRSSECECCVESDTYLARRHFQVTCEERTCVIEDLKTVNGTFVNGNPILSQALFHGDRIHAGRTDFTVEVEAADGIIARGGANGASTTSSVQSAGSTTQRGMLIQISQCPSKTWCLRGSLPEDMSVLDLIVPFRHLAPEFYLTDFSRIGIPFPESNAVSESKLFSWLPDFAAVQTPNLISFAKPEEAEELADEAWGGDSLVILFSKTPKPKLLAALRDCLTDPSRSIDSAQGILGFCWPSVLGALLEQGTHGFPPRLFEHVEAALIEGSKPNRWQLFVPNETKAKEICDICERLGLKFRVKTAEPAQTAA